MASLGLRSDQDVARAAEHEEARRGLRFHAAVTFAVWAVLIVVNITVADEFPWVIFPILGMGIGLVGHWYGVTHVEPTTGRHQLDVEHRARR